MSGASAENHWEIRVERQIPLKRHVAYRVMVNRIAEWWWCSPSVPVSTINANWRANGVFSVKGNSGATLQEGIILEVRPGWYFYITDALLYGGRPSTPSMVGCWSISTTSGEHSQYLNGVCSTYLAVIRHFSEADYLRNRALGLEQGWNEAADRLVKICEERPRPS
jgi:uncharacterized protein YndB with AHSA1/START domain